jgi:hypothetical protein
MYLPSRAQYKQNLLHILRFCQYLDFPASNGRVTDECSVGNDLEGSGHGPIDVRSNIPEFIEGTKARDKWCPEQDLKLRPLKYEARA